MNLHLSRRLIDSRQRMILHLFYVRIFRLLMSQFPSSFLFFIDFFLLLLLLFQQLPLPPPPPPSSLPTFSVLIFDFYLLRFVSLRCDIRL